MRRRDFLFSSVAWAAPEQSNQDILLVVFLRGGCDALNFIVPASGDDRRIYEDERPNIHIAQNSLLSIDPRFGLHPAATGLHKFYQKNQLAVIVGAGMTSNNRSHFDAQAFMELGTPDKKSTGSGWLTRHLGNRSTPGALKALTIGALQPMSLLGSAQATAILQPGRFNSLGGDARVQEDMQNTLMQMYQGSSFVAQQGRSALSAVETMAKLHVDGKTNTAYPNGEIGNHMRTLAQMIKANLGVQVATLDMGGWDTHKSQGQDNIGPYAKQVEQLSGAIEALYQDLGELAPRVTTVVMSEFGRRLRENANRGTDHGHGGMMLVLGSKVKGGKVYGRWPGLKTEQLYERADLAVTTDFRQVLGEVLSKHRGEKNLASVFPDFKFENQLGV